MNVMVMLTTVKTTNATNDTSNNACVCAVGLQYGLQQLVLVATPGPQFLCPLLTTS